MEFALGITIFLTILIGLVDLARAAFLFNGVSDAARELARVTSVHPGTATLGSSSETTAAVSAERALVPGLVVNSYACIDIAGAAVTGHLPARQLGQGLGPDLLPARSCRSSAPSVHSPSPRPAARRSNDERESDGSHASHGAADPAARSSWCSCSR